MRTIRLAAVLAVLAVPAIAVLIGGGVARQPAPASEVPDLAQGWTPDLRHAFSYTPQGSRLAPYAWMQALETPDGTGRFLDSRHFESFGYLPGEAGPLNPDDLPIGFVKDTASPGPEGPWLGLTCAACHTGEFTYQGTRVRVDGGASLADFQGLVAALGGAFDATLADPARFERFAARVGVAPAELRGPVEAYAAQLRRKLAVNATPEPYGRGRLDAFGHILNAVAAEGLGVPENARPPDAPVSYPFLWTAPDQKYVQWNGVAANPIARNTGEVLGVFGTMSLRGPAEDRFRSSVLVDNLHALERWAADLKPPRWPEALLGAIDGAKAARGRELYGEHCQACHGGAPYRWTAPEANKFGRRLIDVTMVDAKVVRTDPTMLQNFYTRRARTGDLKAFFGGVDEDAAGRILVGVVGGVVRRDFAERSVPPEQQAAYAGLRVQADGQPEPAWAGPPSYKAGPLAGVWATGPFLHNGSVPTLYDLLSPEDERPQAFWVGSREIDPVKVGFRSAADELSEAERAAFSRFDTTRRGNSNRGHAFPDPARARLSPEDRLAIIEFLKALDGPEAGAP